MVELTTETVPARRKFDFWRKCIANEVLPLECYRESTGSFYGRLSSVEIGSSRLMRVASCPQTVLLTPATIESTNGQLYLLNYVVSGRGRTSQNGNSLDFQPGDFFLHDTASPGELQMLGDFELVTLSFAKAAMHKHFGRAQHLCALPLSTRQGGCGMVAAEMLQSLASHCTRIDAMNLESLLENFLGVLATAYGELRPQAPTTSTAHSQLLVRIRNYVLAHLADESLCARSIADRHGISVRYLSKLFESDDTTVSKWIWSQRLDACRRSLSTPLCSPRKISEIAYSWGFTDMSHFSFAFKAKFGCSPREFRRQYTDSNHGHTCE